jgi:tRNA A-37 threonylcarbamoyl transferase component Bud32
MRKVLGSGAEATVYFDESSNSNVVDKERSKKSYRHEDIDAVHNIWIEE